MKLNFTSVLLCIMSALPVISCSKSEKDGWSPGTPRLEWDKQESMSLAPSPSRRAPSHAKIVFPGDPIAKLGIHTNCKSDSGRAVENAAYDTTVLNRNEIEIASLLPDPIWRNLEYSKLGRVTCDLKFNVVNVQGSQWSFAVEALEILNLEKLENYKLELDGSQVIKGDDVDYDLACEHFRNIRRLSNSPKLTDLVNELLHGTISNRNGQPEVVDPRLKYGLQKCRLSIDQKNADGTRSRWISQIFEGRFRAPQTDASAQLEFAGSLSLNAHFKSKVLNATLRNNSPAHVAYRLFDLVPNNLGIQLVLIRQNGEFQIGDQFNVTLNYSIENASNIITEGNNRVIEIAPYQTAIITASVTTPRNCAEETAAASPEVLQKNLNAQDGRAYVGYRYAFVNSRFIERLVNWDLLRRDLTSPTEDAKLLESNLWDPKNTPDQIYPGWAPLISWTQIGKGENRKISPGRLTTYCASTYPGPGYPRQ